MSEGEDSTDLVSIFVNKFKPGDNLVKPDEKTIELATSVIPQELISLWEKYGFGDYGDGIIKVINPYKYSDILYQWLGREDENKLPIFLTAFGDIFYYRKLSDIEDDVSLLSIHYKSIDVCALSFEDFMEEYIVAEDVEEDVLRKSLFLEAKEKYEKLNENEIFFFVPALALGGNEDIKYVNKGDLRVQQNILFQMN
ncbi:hypothetical protein BCR32DRAFT_329328 [Anaeromyces robustus]|uniref:GAD-like protein n=1 Tax=Anaeromyces robustus TaxID=1754192 RepID=A0A1Y1WSK3_9FUNG|nr:hypothetical protein BCR32DRAFT_329328 [Anaeromyces robustus]|eukprot:ORX76520.1 hypothetical protein BCR32DRAFT_329328 [Anaeromyces robustus]